MKILNQVKKHLCLVFVSNFASETKCFKFSHIGIKHLFTPREGERRFINLFYKEDLNLREKQPFDW